MRRVAVIVCMCHWVSDREIQEAIDQGAATVDAIRDVCGVGLSCRARLPEVASLLIVAGVPETSVAEYLRPNYG